LIEIFSKGRMGSAWQSKGCQRLPYPLGEGSARSDEQYERQLWFQADNPVLVRVCKGRINFLKTVSGLGTSLIPNNFALREISRYRIEEEHFSRATG
jgi:hypothetical protein